MKNLDDVCSDIEAMAENEELDQDLLDDLVVELKCQEASAINNSGQSSQIEYLRENLSQAEFVKLLSNEN